MQTITPHLWYDKEAEEAAKFYTSIFPNSKIISTTHYGNEGQEITGQEPGKVMTVTIELNGQPFVLLNGGPLFKFNESISFMVPCEDQAEIDMYWEKMSAHPENEQCGWLKDKFGVSWQIIPKNMGELITNDASMKAMLQMHKIDIAALEAAGKE